jgi:Icc-related predicted phosphoesterase
MKFVYTTDLHGDAGQYDASLAAALEWGADLIVNGGDMLPKNGDGDLMDVQRGFLRGLRTFLKRCREKRIGYFAAFGNDDCKSLLPELDVLAADGLLVRMDRDWAEHSGWHFAAFPWVPDTPFILKDWCLIDHESWDPPPQFGPPLLSSPEGFRPYEGTSLEYLRGLPTIADKLALPPYADPPDPKRCAFVMHAPPSGLSLDMTWAGRAIGSHAGREYILRWGFGLSLHGHVHESPKETGVWCARLGTTLCVNPGAGPDPSWVLFDTETRTARHALYGTAAF